MKKYVLLCIASFFGLMGNFCFAQSDNNKIIQRGIDAQKLGKDGEAFQWFQMAAEQGSADGEYHLGYCYLAGQGIGADEGKAFQCFRKGAGQGDGRCEFYLGNCYENGWGTRQDMDTAQKMYQQSAQNGFAAANSALKRLDQASSTPGSSSSAPAPSTDDQPTVQPAGNGVSRGEVNESSSWVSQGYAAFNSHKFAEAYKLFEKAANAGNSEGNVGLASCYVAQATANRDPSKMVLAVKYLRKAADAGNVTGESMLGASYYYGQGVKKDLKKAKEWLQKGALQGNQKAKELLAQMG